MKPQNLFKNKLHVTSDTENGWMSVCKIMGFSRSLWTAHLYAKREHSSSVYTWYYCNLFTLLMSAFIIRAFVKHIHRLKCNQSNYSKHTEKLIQKAECSERTEFGVWAKDPKIQLPWKLTFCNPCLCNLFSRTSKYF